MKRLWFIPLLFLCSIGWAQGIQPVGGVTVAAAPGGDGPNAYYYSYGGSSTSYTTCDNDPALSYHNGGIVAAVAAGTMTSFGIKVNTNAPFAANVCLYDSTASTLLAGCAKTTAGTTEWLECTGQKVSVSATNYLIIWSYNGTNDGYTCRCAGGGDCASTTGKYTTNDYSAGGCPATGTITGYDNDSAGTGSGVRMYVD
jgi:hypothetical protein